MTTLNLIDMGSDIKQGDFFTLSRDKGYAQFQCNEAMQVMELWPKVMTVKCGKNGCMTLPYDHFVKVEDITKFKKVHRYDFELEDRRK